MPKRFLRWAANRRLSGGDFCIVSNNCWGAHVYKNAGMPYATPFVGVAIDSHDYLKLLSNWHWIRSLPVFRSVSSNAAIEKIRRQRQHLWPIGVIEGEVEIHFMHELDWDVAIEKWRRRVDRIPECRDRLFIKFDDVDGIGDEEIERFRMLDFPNKVFFTSSKKRSTLYPQSVFIPTDDGKLPDGWSLSKISPLYFDSAAWISGKPAGRFGWWRFA